MSEKTDYASFKRNWVEPRDRIDRVENILLAGMPDVNLCVDGAESWIEIKSPDEPKRKSTKLFGSNHKLSQEQKNWFLRQRNSGGNGFILIMTDKRWLLIDCHYAEKINDLSVDELINIAIWHEQKPIRGTEKWTQLRNKIIANSR